MSLKIKIFLFPALAIAAAVALVAVGSERYARIQSQQAEQQRTQTLVAQFQREVSQRGNEVVRAVQSVADSEATLRMALDLSRAQADPSVYANDARGLANLYHLDFLELDSADGTLISSSYWPPASGYRNDWVANGTDWEHQSAFLSRVQMPDKVQLGLLAVRLVRVGDRNLYVIGGWRFDREFLRTMAMPEGMRVLLYSSLKLGFNPEALATPEGPVADADPFEPLIESVLRGESPQPRSIQSSDAANGTETFAIAPLKGRSGELLGALLVGSSQPNLATLERYIRFLGLAAAGFGILLSLLMSWWLSAGAGRQLARTSSPAAGRDPVSRQSSHAQAPRPRAEAAPAAAAPSDSSGLSVGEGERLVQRERVAARREMARRFSRDLKESIFPLHMAAEDLLDAREESSERFDEIFFECTTTIRTELDRLKNIAVRFGEFGRMAHPSPAPVNVNEIVQGALKAIESKWHGTERPLVTPELQLGKPAPIIEADPDLLRAALEDLLLHCLDAMPSGGTLSIRSGEANALVRVEVTARGASLSAEDCQRLFAPAGSVPEGMTGLGLATAHAVVTDHGGRMSAESTPDGDVTIRLEFPAAPAGSLRQSQKDTARQAPQQTPQPTPPPQAPKESSHPAPVPTALPKATEVARTESKTISGLEQTEVRRPAPSLSAAEPQPESPSAAPAPPPSEPVLVTVVPTEAESASEDAATSAETSGKTEAPSAAPAAATKSRDWLVLDKNSLRL